MSDAQNTKTEDEAKAAKKAAKEAAELAKAAKKAEAEKAKADKQAEKEAAKAAKEAEKQAKAAAKAEAKAAREANRQPTQNGVRRPGPDGKCGKAWAIFDSLSQAKGSPVAIADALAEGDKQGLNQANVRTEYAQWKKFHGLSGRILSAAQLEAEKTKAEKVAAKEAEKQAKAAEKAAKAAEKAAKAKAAAQTNTPA